MAQGTPYWTAYFYSPFYWAKGYWGGLAIVPTISEDIANPINKVIVLATITGRYEPKKWTNYSGSFYYVDIPAGLHVVNETGAVVRSGTNMLVYASLALLIAGPLTGCFVDDGANRVYIKSTAANLYGMQYQVKVYRRLATAPRTVDGFPFDPRLPDNSVPSQTIKVAPRFGGTPEVGGGDLKVINFDDEFTQADLLVDWDAGSVKIQLVADSRR